MMLFVHEIFFPYLLIAPWFMRRKTKTLILRARHLERVWRKILLKTRLGGVGVKLEIESRDPHTYYSKISIAARSHFFSGSKLFSICSRNPVSSVNIPMCLHFVGEMATGPMGDGNAVCVRSDYPQDPSRIHSF